MESPGGHIDRQLPWDRFYKAARNLIATTAGIHWYDYQRIIAQRIIKAVVEKEACEIVIMLSRQSGKSEIVADICSSLMTLAPDVYPDEWGRGFKVGVFAPKFDLAQIIFSRLKGLFNPEVLSILGMSVTQSNGDTHSLSNGSSCRCLTAKKESSKEGHTFDLAIIDEAQDVDAEVVLKSIYPMTTATAGVRVLIGTATTVKRYFYDVQQRLEGTDRCFILDVDKIMEDRRRIYEATGKKWHLNYEKDFTKQLAERGKDDYLRMAYYLEWVLERGMFITDDGLARCALPYEMVTKTDAECFAGLDLGKEGDRTVLTIESLICPEDMTIRTPDGEEHYVRKGAMLWDKGRARYHSFVYFVMSWVGDRYTDQCRDIVRILRDRFPNLKNLTYDHTGVGVGFEDILYDEARETWPDLLDKVNPFEFGGKPQALSDLWEDLQRVMVNHPMRHFPATREFLPYDPTKPAAAQMRALATRFDDLGRFVKEFTDLEKIWRGPYLKCAVEEGGQRHDDFPNSSALSNYGVNHFAGTRISAIPKEYDHETGIASDAPLTVDSLFEDEDRRSGMGSYSFL